ncbi:TniQ family protein [Luteimonas soli]|uniref:TniQ family protein n=1 Tax=Luteimonas soli TaxID=1648966 RepID=A0ABV7XJU8_9GAMM
MPLRTAGPGLQESLHHYALRIADIGCVSLRALESMLLRSSDRAGINCNAVFPSSWIGPRSKFRELLSALERDTGVDNLRIGTFHVVADVLGRGGTRRRQVRGEGRAWCPACYHLWDEGTSCEPLLWAFDMLTACPIHDTRLETSCPECNSSQSFSVPYRSRRQCTDCGARLGHLHGLMERDKQNRWVNQTLLSFARWIGDTREPVNSGSYVQFIHHVRNRPPEASPLPEWAVRYHSNQRPDLALPTISTLLNWAALQGTTVQEILCDPSTAASTGLFDSQSNQFDGLLFRRRDLTLPLRKVVFVLSELASSSCLVPPPSIVWLELGLWCSVVEDVCPLERSAYAEKYRTQKHSMSAQRFKRGVTSCMRRFKKSASDVDDRDGCLSLLMSLGYSADSANECVSASMALRAALYRAMDNAKLEEFDAIRAARASAWATNKLEEKGKRTPEEPTSG